jgi:hypothetical protein
VHAYCDTGSRRTQQLDSECGGHENAVSRSCARRFARALLAFALCLFSLLGGAEIDRGQGAGLLLFRLSQTWSETNRKLFFFINN